MTVVVVVVVKNYHTATHTDRVHHTVFFAEM